MIVPLLLTAFIHGRFEAGELETAKTFISGEFQKHVREFKENDPATIANFWVKNCIAGFKQLDPDGREHDYTETYDVFHDHPLRYARNLDRSMRLIRLEKVPQGFAALVEQGWTSVSRRSDHSIFKVHSVVQQVWLKTRKGYGLKFTEVLNYQQTSARNILNLRCKTPHRIWNGGLPILPPDLAGQFPSTAPSAIETGQIKRRILKT